MRVQIIKIGNSKGLRIPKAVLEQVNFGEEAELEIQDGLLILRNPAQTSRAHWDEAFKAMRSNNDDILLDDLHESEWDRKDWQW